MIKPATQKTRSRSVNGLTEHQEQALLYQWRSLIVNHLPEMALLHAIPNGAKLPYKRLGRGRTFSPEAMKLKAEGLTPGMLDNELPIARKGYHSLWIEMKVGKNTLTDDQKRIKALLEQQGNYCAVCYTAQDAINMIEWYMGFSSVNYGIEIQGSY